MFGSIRQWWAKPFDSQQNALNWALTVGLIIVAVGMWSRVIRLFEAAAGEL